MNRPVNISVLMSAYNVEKYIGQAIRSVLDQDFENFEFIIINDGSTDRTAEVIRSFTDPRIIFMEQANRGLAAALNRGLAVSRAPLIARFDADDICLPHRLRRQYDFMKSHPGYVIAGSSADYIDEQGDYVFTNYPPAFGNDHIQCVKTRICPFIHSSVIYRKAAVMKHGGYNEHAHSFEDHLLWLKLLQEGRAMNFYEPLIKVRLNPGSITIDERWRPKEFHRIKKNVLDTGSISEAQGRRLLAIIREQNIKPVKESAYHSLLAKKFLWNNPQPKKARNNLEKVISQNRLHWESYCFYLLSFMPGSVLKKWYRWWKPGNLISSPNQQP